MLGQNVYFVKMMAITEMSAFQIFFEIPHRAIEIVWPHEFPARPHQACRGRKESKMMAASITSIFKEDKYSGMHSSCHGIYSSRGPITRQIMNTASISVDISSLLLMLIYLSIVE